MVASKNSGQKQKYLFKILVKCLSKEQSMDIDRIIILVVSSNKSVPPPCILCQIDRRSLCEFKKSKQISELILQ